MLSILSLAISSLNLGSLKWYAVSFGAGLLALLVLIAGIFRVAHNQEVAKTQAATLKQLKVEANETARLNGLGAAAARAELLRKWSRK